VDSKAVLAKSAKGLEEVKSRAHGLSQKLRSILIMVDGTATAGALVAKFGGMPEIAAALDSLAQDGFVEVKGAAAAPPAPVQRAAPPVGATQPLPSPAAPAQSREQALSALTRFLHDDLGPDADFVTGGIERARTQAEFLAAAERCAHTLASARGAAKAQAFRERAKAFADAYLGGG
jgi:pyruvate/2-oxoglutarate dehydrogenase complex dihydrolipoamide acyltransferase (E2) component